MWNLPLGATYWYKNSLDLGTFGISDFWHGVLSIYHYFQVNGYSELANYWKQSKIPSLKEMSSSVCPSSPGPKDTLKQNSDKVHFRNQWLYWVSLQSLGEGLGDTNRVMNTLAPPNPPYLESLSQDSEGSLPPRLSQSLYTLALSLGHVQHCHVGGAAGL